jgi:iron complex transport system substrate-binding protein
MFLINKNGGAKMMKKVTWLSFVLLMVAAMLLASCSKSTTTTAAGPVVLTVTNGSTVKTYSLAALQALKPVTGDGGMMGKGGMVTGPFSYQGVPLTTLLNAVGGVASGQSVTLTGSDGYTKTLTYDQITSGGFSMYDTSGNSVTPTTKPVLAVVYSQNGAPLDSSTGPLELGLLSSQNLVSAGNMWVKLLVKIDIVAAQ